jgi:hypothetical protein
MEIELLQAMVTETPVHSVLTALVEDNLSRRKSAAEPRWCRLAELLAL